MRPTASSSFTPCLRSLARRPTSFNPSKDPLDIANTVGPNAQSFDFPLTRPTLLKLEKQRKLLHYLRLEQLQFKDLVGFRQRFVPPNPSSHFIQVRHQHYQGEPHPASRKVSITLPVSRLGLTPLELHRFKLLAGPRYSPPTTTTDADEEGGTFKLSCELYPNEKMNEKWCSDTLDKLLKESKKSSNQFLDKVPLDQRGITKRETKSRKSKKTAGLKDFPKEWLRPKAEV
ncbi:hypothetical protein JCM3765_001586 [Sporobolomyces pararoseus]